MPVRVGSISRTFLLSIQPAMPTLLSVSHTSTSIFVGYDMQHEYDVDEGAYEMDDDDEAYDGLDAYVGGGHDEDTDDEDYVPPYVGRRGVDDDIDDDDDEEEEEDEDLDRQLDAEDAAEAMEELANMTETGNAGHMNFAHLLESTSMADNEVAAYIFFA